MTVKKNWFTYLILAAFEIMILFSLFSGANFIVKGRSMQFSWQFCAIASMVLLPLIFCFISWLSSVINIESLFKKGSTKSIVTEIVIAVLIIAGGFVARIYAINNFYITPSSDYNTYYQVAELLSKGTLVTEGQGLCDYISLFPHVIGFPFFLSLVFRITGPSLEAGLYFNLIVSMISVFLIYRIARLICGRVGGLFALLLAAFWPSTIIYGTLLASEPLFNCLLLVCLYIVTYMFYYPAFEGKISVSIVLSILLGVVIAIAATVRPVSLILLIAIAVTMLFCNKKFGRAAREKLGIFRCAVCKGWFRIILMTVTYFICSQITSGAVVNAIQKNVPSGSVSFGYNLLVGLNEESHGTWNQEDADLLTKTLEDTGSPEAAHKVCLDKAIAKIKARPVETVNLLFDKFSSLWSNDDYGTTWNLLFLGQQNRLSPIVESKLKATQTANDIAYLAMLSLCAVAGLILIRRKEGSPLLIPALFFIGTALMQMGVESQNRYHYDVLPMFMIIAAFAVSAIYKHYKPVKAEKVPITIPLAAADSYKEAAAQQVVVDDANENKEPLHCEPFDIMSALNDGNLSITVTPAYKAKTDNNSDANN